MLEPRGVTLVKGVTQRERLGLGECVCRSHDVRRPQKRGQLCGPEWGPGVFTRSAQG